MTLEPTAALSDHQSHANGAKPNSFLGKQHKNAGIMRSVESLSLLQAHGSAVHQSSQMTINSSTSGPGGSNLRLMTIKKQQP